MPPKSPSRRPTLLVAALAAMLATALALVPAASARTHRAPAHPHVRKHSARISCTPARTRAKKSRRHSRCVRHHTEVKRTTKRTAKHAVVKAAGSKDLTAVMAAKPVSDVKPRPPAVPSVTITSEPADPTTATSAKFTWTTSGTVSSVQCSENGTMWANCASGITYSNSKAGVNQFSVKVANSGGYRQAYAQWTVNAVSSPAVAPAVSTPASAPASTTNVTPAMANTFGQGMFGIAAGSTLQNESNSSLMSQDLTNDAQAGAKWIRIDINWAQIQYAGPGTYYWTAIDAAVRAAEADGMNVLGTIAYTPTWARPSGASSMYAPDPSQYGAFAGVAAAHYAALGVHTFEIWNEENISGFWNPSPNPAAYTGLLKAAYPAIHAADPNATVVLGGLSPAATDGTNYTPPDFLAAVYADGGQGSFDAVGIHPYCWPAYPGDADNWSAWYQAYGTSTSLRSLMVAHGDAGKKIWGTEFGAPSNGPAGSSFVSQATQAAMITRAYQLWSTYSWAGPLFTYDGRDLGTANTTIENFFGLSNNNFTPKPAYAAYQAAAAAY